MLAYSLGRPARLTHGREATHRLVLTKLAYLRHLQTEHAAGSDAHDRPEHPSQPRAGVNHPGGAVHRRVGREPLQNVPDRHHRPSADDDTA